MKGIVMTQKRYISLPVLAALCMASGFSHSSSEAVTFESAKETMISAGKRTLKGINFVCKNGLVANIAALLYVCATKRYPNILPSQGPKYVLPIFLAAFLGQASWNILTRSTSSTINDDQSQEDNKEMKSRATQMLSYANIVLENGGAISLATPAFSFFAFKAIERAGLQAEIPTENSFTEDCAIVATAATFFLSQPAYNTSAHYIRKYWNAHKQNAQTDIDNESVQQPTQEPEDNSDTQAAKGIEQATA